MAMDDRYEPGNIDVVRDEGVTITFQDGYVVAFDLVTLRDPCPCATCRSLRDQGATLWPRPGSPLPLRIENAELHGAWGLAATWNGRHAHGTCPRGWLRRARDA